MMKIVLSIFLSILTISAAYSQKNYSTNSRYQADVKVYVVDKEYRADLIVYKTDKEYRAKADENKVFGTSQISNIVPTKRCTLSITNIKLT
jgi:hypothetical protein